ncbi:hypothetical protein [Synechococcus sp. M16CYN]|uniref:hypothetical protein n=1 Tax=Synechococcus sp. M16CYN TaxID=3103139 RepID=UPI00333E5375
MGADQQLARLSLIPSLPNMDPSVLTQPPARTKLIHDLQLHPVALCCNSGEKPT